METRPSLGRIVSSFESGKKPFLVIGTNVECDKSARKELRGLE